jgi:hypothetical protein
MSSDQTRNVSLMAELNPFTCGQAAPGQHRTATDVLRAGLRLLIQPRRDLKANPPPKKKVRDGRQG